MQYKIRMTCIKIDYDHVIDEYFYYSYYIKRGVDSFMIIRMLKNKNLFTILKYNFHKTFIIQGNKLRIAKANKR